MWRTNRLDKKLKFLDNTHLWVTELKLYLPEIATQSQHTKILSLEHRLPDFLIPPSTLEVTYSVKAEHDFYLIHLRVHGELKVLCQRCMGEFLLPYENETQVAVCRSEARADQLLARYESMVSSDGQVDLEELIVDELHLYVLPYHKEIEACDKQVK